MGDTQHGDTRFNRHVVSEHGAPPRRLLLHCLSVNLPSLPRPDAPAWSVTVGNRSAGAHGEEAAESVPRSPDDFTAVGDEAGAVLDRDENRDVLRPVVDSGTWEESPVASSNSPTVAERRGVSVDVCAGSGEPTEWGGSDRIGSEPSDIGSYGRDDGTRGRGPEGERIVSRSGSALRDRGGVATSESGMPSSRGLRVSCPPPEDFVAFLRRVPWLDEGCIASLLRGVVPGA